MSRLFLAIPVQLYHYGQIKQEFGPLLEGRWREEISLHLTIAFLGQRFEPDTLIQKLSSFDFSFEPSELSAFEYFSSSRVFVATTQNPTLQCLYERLKRVIELDDADIKPHVTLMRVKQIIDPTIFYDLLQQPLSEPIGILQPEAILYKSVLHPTGAVYERIHAWHIL